MSEGIEKGIASYEERLRTEMRGIPLLIKYLWSLEQTESVGHANDEQQRQDDIDLIWSFIHNGREIEKTIEAKIDTQMHETGNFCFEYISNLVRGTSGCFARTKADLIHYLAIETGELYVLETNKVREWFEAEVSRYPKRFKISTTISTVGIGKAYHSVFFLVPIKVVEKEVGFRSRIIPTDL